MFVIFYQRKDKNKSVECLKDIYSSQRVAKEKADEFMKINPEFDAYPMAICSPPCPYQHSQI